MNAFHYALCFTAVATTSLACGESNAPAPQQPNDVQTTSQSTYTPPASAPVTPPPAKEPPATAPTIGGGTSSDTTRTAAAMGDAEIVAVTSAANNGEIEMAKLANKTSANAQVKSFAAMMIKEHGEAEAKGKQIAQSAGLTPKENDVSTKLKSDGESAMTTMRAKKGVDFDREYMDVQVRVHKDVLSTIDDKLLPNAQSADLKTHLGDVRKHVEKHLGRAQEISQSLSGVTGTGTDRPKR